MAICDHKLVRDTFQRFLDELAVNATGSSNRIARAVLLTEAPSVDRHEITDKGSINQGSVLRNREEIVADLYSDQPTPRVLSIKKDFLQ